MNGRMVVAIRLLTVTVTRSYVAPDGTVTVRLVVDAEVTIALAAPKYTTSADGSLLKFAPVIVTLDPTAAESALMTAIDGGGKLNVVSDSPVPPGDVTER